MDRGISAGGKRRVGQGAWRLWLLAWLCLCAPVLAAPPHSLRFSQLAVEDGLPQESVIAIAQDAQGFIWLGTQTGLARYDGYEFTVYRHDRDDPCSLSDNWIQELLLDRKGRLWVGTRVGVDRFDPGSGCFTRLPLEGSGEAAGVHSMLEDRQGRLWLATPRALFRLDDHDRVAAAFHAGADEGLSAGQVGALAEDGDGALWVRTRQGLDRLPAGAGRFQAHPLPAGPAVPLAVRYDAGALAIDRDGSLWLGSETGLSRWRLQDGRLQSLPVPPGAAAGTAVSALMFDRDGTLWVASNLGLLRLDRGSDAFTQYRHDRGDRQGIADNYVLSLFQDRTGTLWAGTWGNGVSRTDLGGGGFGFYNASDDGRLGLSDAKVYGISSERPGVLWLTTREGGINRLDLERRQVRVYRHVPGDPHSLPTDATLVSRPDGQGGLWVGSDAGLGRLDPQGRYRAWPLPAEAGTSVIYCLYQRPGDPGLWLCTRSGLYRLDPASGRFEGWRHDPADPDSIAADFVATMLQDRAGRVWVATVDGGLDRFDPASGRFEHFRHDPDDPASLSSNRVQALYEDSQGTLWVGTSAGVNRLETGPDGKVRFRVFGSREGLAADSIGAFLEDASGQLWVSGTAGLARLDPRNWTVRNYNAADGLPGGSYFVGAALRDADGTLYFGGVKGLTAVAPDRVRGNPVPPPVAITDFQVFNRSIAEQLPDGLEADAPWPATRRLRMPTSLSVFTIAFAALHYADPARNQYAYRLEGFDSDWLRTGADRRFATYTNLDPGRYVFRVRAANKDGIWNEEGAALEIVVTPPWWRTWWFRIGGLLALAAAAIVLYRRRIHRLQWQQATLEQRVEERTFELEQARMDLEQASLTDPLTGMRNRRFLRQQLDSDLALSVRAYQRAALHGVAPPEDVDLLLFLVDIDHFKRVNDEQGHAAGDEILVEVHARLRQVLRASDYLVRWGGEEFLVVARGTRRSTAPVVAEHIREVFADQPFVLSDGTRLVKTCSIGFASLPLVPAHPAALDWHQAVDLTDIALYAAKAAGRDGWVGIEAGPDADPSRWGGELRSEVPGLLATGQLRFITRMDPARVAEALQGGLAAGMA